MKARLELPAGSSVRVAGPLRARVESGVVMVLGALFHRGGVFEVSEYRSYAVKALDDSVVEFEVLPGSSIEKPLPGEEVLDQWVAVADEILSHGCSRVMVLGPVEAGKSSFTALMANRALLRGLRVGVIDADIGQADIGPPAAVSGAIVEKPVLWLRELRPSAMRFVGSVTPQRVERKVEAAIVDVSWRLQEMGAEVLVVDTDGWVQGINSIEYKVEAARLLGVDAVVAINPPGFLEHALNYSMRKTRCGVHVVGSPSVKRTRDRGDRRDLRSQRYRVFLEGAYPRELWLRDIGVYGSCFFSGQPLGVEEVKRLNSIVRGGIVAASETGDTVYVVVSRPLDQQALTRLAEAVDKPVYVLDKRNVRGALAAVLGPSGEEEALALVEDIDFSRQVVKILTPFTGEVTGLVLGHIRLNSELVEEGRPLRCII